MVFVNVQGRFHPIFVGPLSGAGSAAWGGGAEILWIKFKLGVYLRQMPPIEYLDSEQPLPEAGNRSFWLDGSTWQYPDFENVEEFINRLARQEALVYDPVVRAALQGHPVDLAPRTLRHRFLQSTGLSRGQIVQSERAQAAAERLMGGGLILDTVFELGYYDQPHLTRSLKRWVGKTPAQIQGEVVGITPAQAGVRKR
jgi:AraC-like DNA-binding protein